MEHRKMKVMVNKAGGNAGPDSYNYRVSIPTSWAKELNITKQDNSVDLSLENGAIIIKRDSAHIKSDALGYSLQERMRQERRDAYRIIGNAFFYDKNSNDFYLVNFQEETYLRIDKDGPYSGLCKHLYCHDWAHLEGLMQVKSTYREVVRLEQIDGSEG